MPIFTCYNDVENFKCIVRNYQISTEEDSNVNNDNEDNHSKPRGKVLCKFIFSSLDTSVSINQSMFLSIQLYVFH